MPKTLIFKCESDYKYTNYDYGLYLRVSTALLGLKLLTKKELVERIKELKRKV